MNWKTFSCPKCGYETTQAASAEIVHKCPKTGRNQALKVSKDDA